MLPLLVSLFACSGCNPPPQAPTPAERTAVPDRPDIVLVVVDGLRPDRLGPYGYTRGITPNLDAWAEDAAVFTDLFAHSTTTRPGMTSLLTGLSPDQHGVHTAKSSWTGKAPALPGILRSRDGYATAAVVSSPQLAPSNNPIMRGFETLDATLAKGADPRGRPTSADAVEAATALWDKHHEEHPDKPLFLMVHLIDPLPPWVAHPTFDLGEEDGDLYDSEIAGMDAALGSLFDTVGEGSVVVLTATHGASLGLHRREAGVGGPPWVEQVRIPLIVRGPGILAEPHRKLLGQRDIAPGILRSARLKRMQRFPSPGWKINTFGNIDYAPRTVPMEVRGPLSFRAVRHRNDVLMVDEKGRMGLYDLSEDPHQQTNLLPDKAAIEANAETIAELKALLPVREE